MKAKKGPYFRGGKERIRWYLTSDAVSVGEQLLRITYSSNPDRQGGLEIILEKKFSPPIERLKKGVQVHLAKRGREIMALEITEDF